MNHGRIEDEGTPERVYAQPATRFTATFMGESTIVAGHGAERHDQTRRSAAFAGARRARRTWRSGPSTSSLGGAHRRAR